jgi:hypothetical protein
MIEKVKHLVRVELKVTFDSNAYRQAVDPSRSRRDANPHELRKINAAINDGRISGYLSETLVTLEGIKNADRSRYIAGVEPKISRAIRTSPDGETRMGFLVEADDALHPGLNPILARWVARALSSGLRFLKAPRIGAPRPGLREADFAVELDDHVRGRRQQQFFEAARAIEGRGFGIAKIKAIGERIKNRTGSSGPWYRALDRTQDDQERKEIERAVNEWADADTVATHIGYELDVLCTADKAENSVFSPSNRAWLEQQYGVRILTLPELAAELCASFA